MSLYEKKCRCRIVRFEERAREFVHMAKANLNINEQPKGNQQVCMSSIDSETTY